MGHLSSGLPELPQKDISCLVTGDPALVSTESAWSGCADGITVWLGVGGGAVRNFWHKATSLTPPSFMAGDDSREMDTGHIIQGLT